MCNMSQFIVSTSTSDIISPYLATLFMENVILSFGMYSVIVVDDESPFKGVFKEICSSLKITHWVLSQGNHKVLSVERFH